MPAQKPVESIDIDRSQFNIFDEDQAQRLYEVMADARQHCPVFRTAAEPGCYVTRYRDVRSVAEDHELFSSAGAGPLLPTVVLPPLSVDPPIHRDYRMLLNRFFSPASLAKHEPALHRIAAQLIEGFLDEGRLDFPRDYAAPFTAGALAEVVLHIDDANFMARAREAFTRGIEEHSPESFAAQGDIVREALAIRAAATEPRDDALGAITTGTVAGRPLTEDEKFGTTLILIAAGLDTTKTAMTYIALRLATNPDLEARLRDPEWIKTDFDEFLRADPTTVYLLRTVTRDTELAGTPLKSGERIAVCYASANRDEEQFDRADELVFGRTSNLHVAFGLGIHRCLGSHFARLQMKVAFEELFRKMTNLRRASKSDIRYVPGAGRSLKSLPLLFDKIKEPPGTA